MGAKAMSTTVARLYPSYGGALEAYNDINSHGFHRDEIDLISRDANTQESEIKDLDAEISRAGIPADKVAAYAAAIDEGKSLLVVRAAFGAAKKAIRLADEGASETDPLNAEFYVSTFATSSVQDASDISHFSLSAYLGIPLLISDATPFSRFWNLPVLLRDAAPFSSFFSWPTLSHGFTFGEPKLINNGAAFSDELRIPTLSKSQPDA
jgi:hypothetical protein